MIRHCRTSFLWFSLQYLCALDGAGTNLYKCAHLAYVTDVYGTQLELKNRSELLAKATQAYEEIKTQHLVVFFCFFKRNPSYLKDRKKSNKLF